MAASSNHPGLTHGARCPTPESHRVGRLQRPCSPQRPHVPATKRIRRAGTGFGRWIRQQPRGPQQRPYQLRPRYPGARPHRTHARTGLRLTLRASADQHTYRGSRHHCGQIVHHADAFRVPRRPGVSAPCEGPSGTYSSISRIRPSFINSERSYSEMMTASLLSTP